MMRATMHVTDYDAIGRPRAENLATHTARMSAVLAQELAGAAAATRLSCEEILLATLGRAIQRTIGEGFTTVDVARAGNVTHPVALACMGPDRIPATDMLAAVGAALAAVAAQRTIRSVPHHGDDPSAADVLFAFGAATPAPARLGHFLELHASVSGAELLLEWWYDSRSYEPYTIVELAEQFCYAMIELTSEATRPIRTAPELAAAY